MTRPAAPLRDVVEQLRQLADQVEQLDVAQLVGRLEAIKFAVWMTATNHPPAPAPTGPSRGLDIAVVSKRTGMSKDWLYRQARAGRLPFAYRLGRRVLCDEARLAHWLDRRAGQGRW